MRWSEPPGVLTHVTQTIDSLESILGSQRIWARRSLEVRGDDAELRVGEDLIRAVARDLLKRERRPFARTALEAFLSVYPQERISQKAKVFLACFTTDVDDNHWNTYGNSSSGFAISFNVVPPQRPPDPELDLALTRVLYDPDEVKGRVRAAFKRAFTLAQLAQPLHRAGWAATAVLPKILRLAATFAIQTKHRRFANETEWRLVSVPLPSAQHRIELVPFEHVAVELNAGAHPNLREVRIGPMHPAPDSAIARIAEFLRASGYPVTPIRVG